MIDDKNTSKIETARKKYNAYDSTMWIKIFFDENTGGYVVVDKERAKNSSDKTSNNENRKYAKELAMSIVFARNGYGIEMLREIPRVSSPDVNIDGIPGELKKVESLTHPHFPSPIMVKSGSTAHNGGDDPVRYIF